MEGWLENETDVRGPGLARARLVAGPGGRRQRRGGPDAAQRDDPRPHADHDRAGGPRPGRDHPRRGRGGVRRRRRVRPAARRSRPWSARPSAPGPGWTRPTTCGRSTRRWRCTRSPARGSRGRRRPSYSAPATDPTSRRSRGGGERTDEARGVGQGAHAQAVARGVAQQPGEGAHGPIGPVSVGQGLGHQFTDGGRSTGPDQRALAPVHGARAGRRGAPAPAPRHGPARSAGSTVHNGGRRAARRCAARRAAAARGPVWTDGRASAGAAAGPARPVRTRPRRTARDTVDQQPGGELVLPEPDRPASSTGARPRRPPPRATGPAVRLGGPQYPVVHLPVGALDGRQRVRARVLLIVDADPARAQRDPVHRSGGRADGDAAVRQRAEHARVLR